MKHIPSVRQSAIAFISCFFACFTGVKAQFTISGYQQTSTPGQYNILGTNLLSVNSLTYTPYNVAGTTPDSLSFTPVSNDELTINLGQNITNIVDLVFSNATYTNVEVPFVIGQINGQDIVPLTTVGPSQAFFGSGSAVILVLPGGSAGENGGSTAFVEAGGNYSTDGGGSNTIYYLPGANVSNAGGGGSNVFIEVNAINQLKVVPEPSTWALLLGGLGLLVFWRTRRTV